MGIMIDKNNLEGGSKEELVEYIFSVCNNIKRKKIIKSKKWSVVKNIISVLILIVFILSIMLLILRTHKIDEYMELLQQNGYYIEIKKYVIENEMGYVVLIQKDNYVFYGIGDTRYKEELDNVVSLIEQEMK